MLCLSAISRSHDSPCNRQIRVSPACGVQVNATALPLFHIPHISDQGNGGKGAEGNEGYEPNQCQNLVVAGGLVRAGEG